MVFNRYCNKSFYGWLGLAAPAWGAGLCLLAGFKLPIKPVGRGTELLFRQVVVVLPEGLCRVQIVI